MRISDLQSDRDSMGDGVYMEVEACELNKWIGGSAEMRSPGGSDWGMFCGVWV